jgi:hypothetical protein
VQLASVIARVESSNNQNALRFENTMFASPPIWVLGQISNIQKAHRNMSYQTAQMIACSSWGMYQLLGANIWSNGFAATFADYIDSATFQYGTFLRFISPHGFTGTEDCVTWNEKRYERFAAFYNGPNAVSDYVSAMKQAQGS